MPEPGAGEHLAQEMPVLGERELAELRDLDPSGDMVGTLVNLYLEDARPRLERLAAAWDAADLPLVAELAHLVKGSALTFGALALVQSAGRVEATARNGQLPTLEQMEQVRACGDRVISALLPLADSGSTHHP